MLTIEVLSSNKDKPAGLTSNDSSIVYIEMTESEVADTYAPFEALTAFQAGPVARTGSLSNLNSTEFVPKFQRFKVVIATNLYNRQLTFIEGLGEFLIENFVLKTKLCGFVDRGREINRF